MSRLVQDHPKEDFETRVELSVASSHGLLMALVGDLLKTSVDPAQPLVAQGFDSMMAAELLESIQARGLDVPYADLMDSATIESLVSSLRKLESDGPQPTPSELASRPVPLTGQQIVWTELEERGWGSWSNISLCLSMPASLIPAAFLPAMVQSLCEANDAMRMVLVPPNANSAVVQQQNVSGFQVAIRMHPAPRREKDAIRLIEAFEGEEASPFQPSTRALILSSSGEDERHWLCLSMHHIFCDRVSMQSLAHQIRTMIIRGELRHPRSPVTGFLDYALWQQRILREADSQVEEAKLRDLLSGADVSTERPFPRLTREDSLDLGRLPSSSTLRPAEGDVLRSLATQLETTVPLLFHAVFSVLVARLTGDDKAVSGEADMLLCHVVSNRQSDGSLRGLVGCLDTSIPVAVRLTSGETLQSLCRRTQHAFSEAYRYASRLPRGIWFGSEGETIKGDQPVLFERVAHINVLPSPARATAEEDALDIRVHPVRRVQKTRWGLLLRVNLPPAGPQGAYTAASSGISIRAFAEHGPLAVLAHDCFVRLLRALIGKPQNHVGGVAILRLVDEVIDHASFASAQVRRAAAMVSPGTTGEAFIWDKLAARQLRWYEHDENRELLRDKDNRFVGTAANPFPFTQLDKLKERRFLDSLDVPQPSLLHVLPQESLPDSLVGLAPSLPTSFAIKPVGAGHSFGVTIVRDGLDLTRNSVPFDVETVARELMELASRGVCHHEGHAFRFNFSSFLIEELVIDERGFGAPTDYKVFMVGDKLLWIQVHFKAHGHTWVAFVDEAFTLLSQPAWDPRTCWRTHRALVCTDQEMVLARKPRCLPEIIEHSTRLGSRLNLFVRLDWYADGRHGPLMGEMTTFPHMLQPRSFYSAWANEVVKAAWQDPDGVAPVPARSERVVGAGGIARISKKLHASEPSPASLQDFLSSPSQGPWAVDTHIYGDDLREYLTKFDLAPWGIASGDRVALLLPNGVPLAGLMLATMNRYVALPLGPDLTKSLLIEQLRQSAPHALLVIAGSNEARQVSELGRALPSLIVIELTGNGRHKLAALPDHPETGGPFAVTPTRGPNDTVLILRTSGTTGESKIISFTLSRLVLGGAVINESLRLSPADLGISMLPLHHVGGISCNLIAPMIAGTPMRYLRTFDPKAFFDSLAGPEGATWCYLVSTMWEMVLEYARSHPEFRQTRPWPRLRLIRSAGSDLPHRIALELADLFGNSVTILPTYGMTEAMPVAAPPLDYRLERPGSVGLALPTVSIEIVDPSETGNLDVVSDGTIGEVTVKGPMVLYDEDAGSGLFTPRGFYRTGDLGRMAPDSSGWLHITGRIKDVINRGGETIAPAEIEAVLYSYPGWKDAPSEPIIMVFARAHDELQEDVAVAITPSTCTVDLVDLNAWASRHLPPSMLPQTLIRLDALPYSKHGKLLRARFAMQMNALLEPARLGCVQVYRFYDDFAAPRLVHELEIRQSLPGQISPSGQSDTTLESVLALVQDFVGDRVKVGPDTRFEDVDINSLAAVELAGQLNTRFSTQLPPWVISDYPTPRAILSELIRVSETAVPSATESSYAGIVAIKDQPRSRPLRVLLLHGEAADAELMDLSMQAAHWTGVLEGQVEFVFMDAPHRCGPEPRFHPAAVESGLYTKEEYGSWGINTPATLEESIEATFSALDALGPVDGIGGICEGGLVAALVAARRPELKLYLNFSSSPLTQSSPELGAVPWTISCASLHLVSPRDELFSYQQLLEIPSRCQKALVLQHPHGHSVPRLDSSLKSEVLAVLRRIASDGPEPLEPPSPEVEEWETGKSLHRGAMTDAGPPTAVEKRLARIWQKILKQDHEPGLDDDFMELGGTSLLTMILLREMENEFGRKISASVLLNLTTIRHLARAIETLGEDQTHVRLEPETSVLLRDSGLQVEAFYHLLAHTTRWPGKRARHQSLVVGLNTESLRAPLFYCAAAARDFGRMATLLGPDQPVYGMRSGHVVMERTPANLEILARYYVGEILSIQPEGPYLIGGYCRGVKLAFQIALEFRRQGKRVSGLFLLEQMVPIWFPGRITLFFGTESHFNPLKLFEITEEDFKEFYPGRLAVRTIQGGHYAFWRKPGVDTFVSQLKTEIEDALTASVQEAEIPERKPLLPAVAHKATIRVPKLLLVTPGEKSVRIQVRITNASSTAWHSGEKNGPILGYWINWGGKNSFIYHSLGGGVPVALAPGESLTMPLDIKLPNRMSRHYRAIIDLVDNRSRWFHFDGSPVATVRLPSHPFFWPLTWMRRIRRLIKG